MTRVGWDGRRPLERHLLGLGVLVVTIICGYAVSGLAVVRAPRQVESAPAPVVDIDTFIAIAASRYGVSEELIAAIIEAESEFNPRAVSRRGAQGLMQLMPETAATLGVNDPFDPRANIDGGVRHLRALMDRFDNNLPLALAAYNAGEVAVIKHRGVPPYRETRGYVNRILRRLNQAVSHDLSRT
jgi:soluble lytic murein transglycosylase-like protein